jgi:toxin ParE1/3/4
VSGRIEIHEVATRDLAEQADYLWGRSPRSAERFTAAVQQTFQMLLRTPGLGRPRDYGIPELAGMRMKPVVRFKSHLIFYRPTEYGIEIIRVLHAARDIESLFREGT